MDICALLALKEMTNEQLAPKQTETASHYVLFYYIPHS
jgi:hypothetical protein